MSTTPIPLTAATCGLLKLINTFSFLTNKDLTFSNNNQTVEWVSDLKYAWIPVETQFYLFDGEFSLDFLIDDMKGYQIGIGFLQVWDFSEGKTGVDWGFYGYLGSSDSAYSYDPSTGDVVTNTKELYSGFPILKQNKGVVTLRLNLPAEASGEAWFVIEGIETNKIKLPVGSVITPAVCLSRKGQKVTITNLVETSKKK